MEEAQCEFIKGGERYMTNEVTKDGDVTETRKREKSQEIHTQNSWMENIFMLISFLFSFVIRGLICLYPDEDESTEKLFAGLMKEKLKFSMKFENVLEKQKEVL